MSGRAQDEVDKLLSKAETNGRPKVFVERTLFSQKQFDENFEAGRRPSPTFRDVVRKNLSKCMCSRECVKQFIYKMFPFISIMKDYNIRQDITGDIVSGLTIGIMHIPQGMAYGMLTTLPPVYGLYMSFFPVLIYFFFGSSKHASTGTFAVVCLMVGSVVSRGINSVTLNPTGVGVDIPGIEGNQSTSNMAFNITTFNQSDATTPPIVTPGKTDNDDDEGGMSAAELDLRLQFAMSVSFVAGVIQLLMGVFRLGFITVYLSDPLISGFTTGAACHVFTSQIKHIFGVKTARYSGALKLVYTYRDFFKNIEMTNMVTVLLSVVCIVILYCTGRFINQNPKLKPKMFMPVPIELIVVVLGTVISYAIKLETQYKVVVVSDIPTGLPVPDLKPFSRISDVISDAIALAIVIFAISVSMGKLLAKKHDYSIDPNQELIAYGISSILSSFLSSSAPCASLSRSLVQEGVGGKTQVAGLISCCLMLVVLLAIGPYFRTLPNCVLASIIIVALRGMFLQVLDLKRLWRVSLIDFFVWIVAFLATVLLDVDLGLGIAVIFNLLTVVCRSQRPYATLLGQIPGTDIYRDLNVYQEAQEVPGIKIFRFEHSLFFVNTEHFKTFLYKRTVNPRDVKIARKKRESRMKKMKKKELMIVGDEVPDVSIPVDALEMEMDAKTGAMKVTVVAQNKPSPASQDIDFHTLILDCSPWSFIDSMGVKLLAGIISEFKVIGVNVILANCKGGIREMFSKTKFYDTLDHSNMYVSLHDAVIQSLHANMVNSHAQDVETPDLSEQRAVSHDGSSVLDRDDSVTDYNIDFIDDESSLKDRKKPLNGSTA